MELRWVLLGLGLLVILGVYLAGRGIVRMRANPTVGTPRREPRISTADAPDSALDTEVDNDDVLAAKPKLKRGFETTVIERKPSPRMAPEKVVAVRLVPTDKHPTGEVAVLAMRKLGLEHGMYGIFHKISNGDLNNPLFSVASLTEPGSFDLTKLAESEVAGLSLFLTLPGIGDPVERFDDMIATARSLGRELNAELFDEKASSWSVQRERFLREEMIEYRHHYKHS